MRANDGRGGKSGKAVHFIRTPKEDEKSKSGIGGYADTLEEMAKDAGYQTDSHYCVLNLSNGIRHFIREDMLGIRSVLKSMDPKDICHFTYEGCAFFIGSCKAYKITTFNHVVKRKEGNNLRWYMVWYLSARHAVKHSDLILVQAEEVKNDLIEYMHADPDKVLVMPNLSVYHYDIDPDVGKEKVIGTMASFVKRKNYPALLRVFRMLISDPKYSDYRLRIVGRSTGKDEILKLIDELGISDSVEILEDLTNTELNTFYNSCKIVLNTSMYEGLGLLTLEAQSCGTPVLYFESARLPANIMQASIGCSDEQDMAEKIKSLLSDDALYAKVRSEAKVYSDRIISDAYERLCRLYDGGR